MDVALQGKMRRQKAGNIAGNKNHLAKMNIHERAPETRVNIKTSLHHLHHTCYHFAHTPRRALQEGFSAIMKVSHFSFMEVLLNFTQS